MGNLYYHVNDAFDMARSPHTDHDHHNRQKKINRHREPKP